MPDQVKKSESVAGDAPDFRTDLLNVLNYHSRDNGSNTGDWILRDYLCDCLKAFDVATLARDQVAHCGDTAPQSETAP